MRYPDLSERKRLVYSCYDHDLNRYCYTYLSKQSNEFLKSMLDRMNLEVLKYKGGPK